MYLMSLSRYDLNRVSYMSAQVLLKLLFELMEIDKMQGLSSFFFFFLTSFIIQ